MLHMQTVLQAAVCRYAGAATPAGACKTAVFASSSISLLVQQLCTKTVHSHPWLYMFLQALMFLPYQHNSAHALLACSSP
jgi:hypothetical protein